MIVHIANSALISASILFVCGNLWNIDEMACVAWTGSHKICSSFGCSHTQGRDRQVRYHTFPKCLER